MSGSASGSSARRGTEGSVVEGLRVFGGSGRRTYGIFARGIIRNNAVISIIGGEGIAGFGTVTGNYTANNGIGLSLDQGSTVIGNTAWNNAEGGISVGCPSNVTSNTAVGNVTSNLTLIGEGCNNTNNVAP
jgi:hypothetical protein